MSKPKESIAVEKLKVLSTALGDFRAIIDKTIADCEAAELDAVLVEGWPTLARGFQFMIDQAKKLVGPASKIHVLSGSALLMPGQTFTPTKKAKAKAKAVEAVALANAAEQRATYDAAHKQPPPKKAARTREPHKKKGDMQ
jgi:hypothetical protein